MDIDDLKKLVDGNPDTLIKFAEDNGIDLGGLDKDIARKMVKEKFSLTDEQIESVDFVFWFAYMVEKDAETLIIEPEVMLGARTMAMLAVVSKMHFGDKIKVIEELYSHKQDPFIKLMRVVQNLRNDVAHGRFERLNYEGYPLHDNRGKLKLIAHLRDVMRKKDTA